MAEKWIQKATANAKGQLRKTLGAKPGKPIPTQKLAAAASKPSFLSVWASRARRSKSWADA